MTNSVDFTFFYIFFIVFLKNEGKFGKNHAENIKNTGNFCIFTCDFYKIVFFDFLITDFLTLSYSILFFMKRR